MGKGLESSWRSVQLMETVESLSHASGEAEDASSSKNEEVQQLRQRDETEEASNNSAALTDPLAGKGEEKEKCATAGSFSRGQSTPEYPAGDDRDEGLKGEKGNRAENVACPENGADCCPKQQSTASLSRKTTASFTSRGNTLRFLGQVIGSKNSSGGGSGGEAENTSWKQETDDVGDGLITAAATRDFAEQVNIKLSQPPCTEKTGALKNVNPAKQENDTPSNECVTTDQVSIDEQTENDCPLRLKDRNNQRVQTTVTAPTLRSPSQHQHSVPETTLNVAQGGPLVVESASSSCQIEWSAALQGALPDGTSTLPKEKCNESFFVESYEFHRGNEGDGRVAEEQTEDNAVSESRWGIKRSASDGPSRNIGVWENVYDFKERSADVAQTCTSEGTGSAIIDGDLDGDAPSAAGRIAFGCQLKENVNQGPRRVAEVAPQRVAPPLNIQRRCVSPKSADINRTPVLPRANLSAGEERRSKDHETSDGEGAGECWYLNMSIGTKLLRRERAHALTHSPPLTARGEWEQHTRRASTTGAETAFHSAHTRAIVKDNKNTGGRWSSLSSSEDVDKSNKETLIKTLLGTAPLPRRKEADNKHHPPALKRAETCILPINFPGDARCEEMPQTARGALCWRNSRRSSPASARDDERWHLLESEKALSSGGPPTGSIWKPESSISLRGRDLRRNEGPSRAMDSKGALCGEDDASVLWKEGHAVEESGGTRLVRELVEEFDKRRTNFSILVPKVLELLGVLMGQPAGRQLPCVFPRSFSPAACLLNPSPLPVCATFSEVGQTSTIKDLEKYFPAFHAEGGLLLCTQVKYRPSYQAQRQLRRKLVIFAIHRMSGEHPDTVFPFGTMSERRRLESGGGGKYYFRDSKGHVVGCHKQHLAQYDAQGRLASPVLLKTLLFCLVLKQVSRTKHENSEIVGEHAFKLPPAATSEEAALCRSPALSSPQMSSPTTCRARAGAVFRGQEREVVENAEAEVRAAWRRKTSSAGSPRLPRSLLDPLPSADALLAEAALSAQAEGRRRCAEQPSLEPGSARTSASSNCHDPSMLLNKVDNLGETAASAEKKETSRKGCLPLQGGPLTRRSGTWSTTRENFRNLEEFSYRDSSGMLLQRASSTAFVVSDKLQSSSGEQRHRHSTGSCLSAGGGSPPFKRESDMWECVADARNCIRERKRTNFSKEMRRQQLLAESAESQPRESSGFTSCCPSANSCVEPGSEYRFHEEKGDATKSAEAASPALSSPLSLSSSALHSSPAWWGGSELGSKRDGKPEVLSAVRSSNPQRLVRVYRSLVVEEKTHVVERLLRVWSMTLHVRTSQSSSPLYKNFPPFPPDSARHKLAPKHTLEAARTQKHAGVSKRAAEQLLSGDEELTEEESEEGVELNTEEIHQSRNAGGSSLSGKVQQSGRGREKVLGARDATLQKGKQQTTRAAGGRAGESPLRGGGGVLYRKSNTTDCGRILRSLKSAEKSAAECSGYKERRLSASGADVGQRRMPRLRRASTSARGGLEFLRRKESNNNNNEEEEEEEEHFICGRDMEAHSTGACSRPFGQRGKPLKKRSFAKQGASASSFGNAKEGSMEEERTAADAFLWRPCMSILWVKPLTVEQTMLKWSKSTPLYDSLEESNARCREREYVCEGSMGYEDRAAEARIRQSVNLRSAANKKENSTPLTSSPKTSYHGERNGEQNSHLLNTCSPKSVRSEVSTTADCTPTSLPVSPHAARLSASTGSRQSQNLQKLQQAVQLPRLRPPTLPHVEQSPPPAELLQAIQQQLLQLLRPSAGESAEPAPHTRAAPHALQQLPAEETNQFTCRAHLFSSGPYVHSRELSLALRLDRLHGGPPPPPPRSNTKATVLESRSSSIIFKDDSSHAVPEIFRSQKAGRNKLPQLDTTAALLGEGMADAAAAGTTYSDSEPPVSLRNNFPASMMREMESSKYGSKTPTPGLEWWHSRTASDSTSLSRRSGNTSANVFAEDIASRSSKCTSTPTSEEQSADGYGYFDVAKGSVSGIEACGGQQTTLQEGWRALESAESPRQNEGRALKEIELLDENEVSRGVAERQQQNRTPEVKVGQAQGDRRQNYNNTPVLSLPQVVPPKAKISVAKTGYADDCRNAPVPGNTALSVEDMDSLSLISRLLGFSVNNDPDARENCPAQSGEDIENATRGSLAARTAHALAALLSLQGTSTGTVRSGGDDFGNEPAASTSLVPSETLSPEDQMVSCDISVHHTKRVGQPSRKRVLDAEEVQKQEERGAEGRKKVASLLTSPTFTGATLNETERVGAPESLQQESKQSPPQLSPLAQRQQKKTKWSGLRSGEAEARAEIVHAADAFDIEGLSHVQEHLKGSRRATGVQGVGDESCVDREQRWLTESVAWEQCSAQQGLLDLLLTQVLQQSPNAGSAARKEANK